MMPAHYPETSWELISPAQAGFDPEKLAAAKNWLTTHAEGHSYRVVIVHHGKLVAEWNHLIYRDEKLPLASAAKSIYSCILGIAIHEGLIHSADDHLVEYYPEAMDVPEGEGPKENRFAFDKDEAVTLGQLISNTSGYMKPGEAPGKVFHYQTYGMNVLCHAVAKVYGLYDVNDLENSPGLSVLMEEKIGRGIGSDWDYFYSNFDLHPKARLNIFGYAESVASTALDMARLGWLWCNWGRWAGQQLIPETWLRKATQTAPAILQYCPVEQWKYGLGFWTNDHGQLFPNLPRDSYAAQGAGSQHIWVCPSLDCVVVQSPGIYSRPEDNDSGLLRHVVSAFIDLDEG